MASTNTYPIHISRGLVQLVDLERGTHNEVSPKYLSILTVRGIYVPVHIQVVCTACSHFVSAQPHELRLKINWHLPSDINPRAGSSIA